MRRLSLGLVLVLAWLAMPARGLAQPVPVGEPPPPVILAPPGAAGASALEIHRTSGPIRIDGVLDDAGWTAIAPIDDWYETSPGNNTPPRVKTRGRLAYDGDALYVGLELDDPDPSAIRAPFADRDNVQRDTDYAGIVLDAADSGRVGALFLVNARGVQYDSISDDSTGVEDPSPDFFWDAAARIHDHGWTLEIRIPFSSLSYPRRDPQVFRAMLFRNYPRDFRYKLFTSPLPRDSSCFICLARPVVGLRDLPAGGSLVVAPYLSGSYAGAPSGALGSRLHYKDPDVAAGVDAKWRPFAGTVIDLTINPDFSQIESDVAQITANQRFAILYPEKRPFFLEGVELLATPIPAVSTRSVTDPQWGARGTVKVGDLAFTALAAQDEGGGQVILPGASASGSADQAFRSWAGIARARYDFGRAFLGALATTREVDGGGFNRLGGLDFQARPFDSDSVSGQLLYSFTRTPELPALAAEWDGRYLAGHAGFFKWLHTGELFDATAIYRDFGSQFRADDGYVPQVGIREAYGEAGLTTRPDAGWLRRLQGLVTYDWIGNPSLDLVSQEATAGASMDLVLGTTLQVSYAYDQILVGDQRLPRHQAVYSLSVNPGALVSRIDLSGSAGQQIDFANARTGTGLDATLGVTVRPTSHLELMWNEGLRWVDVDVAGQPQSRLFTARIDRLSATYSFTARLFLRLIAQYEVTTRAPALYLAPVAGKDADFSGSLLFAYKINWQSVLFVGYGDDRTFLTATDRLEPQDRQLFIKLSRAFQW